MSAFPVADGSHDTQDDPHAEGAESDRPLLAGGRRQRHRVPLGPGWTRPGKRRTRRGRRRGRGAARLREPRGGRRGRGLEPRRGRARDHLPRGLRRLRDRQQDHAGVLQRALSRARDHRGRRAPARRGDRGRLHPGAVMEARGYLLRQLDTAWKLARFHLDGLTTDACLWRPATRGLHVTRLEDGRWRADWPERESYDIGPPSIAWVTWHMIFWWSMVLDHSFGPGTLERGSVSWPG